MKKLLFIFVALFLIHPLPVFAQTGTWSYQLIRTWERPWGLEALVKFERSPTGETTARVLCFKDQDQLMAEGPTRVANIQLRLELHYSPLNDFDLGENSREIMKALIIWVRNHPDATFEEAVSIYDIAYPDAIWKGNKFFLEAQDWIIENNDVQSFTWEQFKTYVINNVFVEIDG